jgi:hypothetical protein
MNQIFDGLDKLCVLFLILMAPLAAIIIPAALYFCRQDKKAQRRKDALLTASAAGSASPSSRPAPH